MRKTKKQNKFKTREQHRLTIQLHAQEIKNFKKIQRDLSNPKKRNI